MTTAPDRLDPPPLPVPESPTDAAPVDAVTSPMVEMDAPSPPDVSADPAAIPSPNSEDSDGDITLEPVEPLTLEERLHLVTEPDAQPFVVQDFAPVDESLEWKLSQTYFDVEGSRAFVAGEVPYIVNNDGRLSDDAATLWMAMLDGAAEQGTLPDTVRALELGAGSGLFAKLFLDALKRQCEERDLDYYDRTTYYITDGSHTMLEQMSASSLLDEHADRVVIARVQAESARQQLSPLLDGVEGAFHAVFLNYILDNLPSKILHIDGARVHELTLRIALDQKYVEERGGAEAFEDIRRQLLDHTSDDREEMVRLYSRFLLDTKYEPVERDFLPRSETLPPVDDDLDSATGLYMHSYGALDVLDELIPCLAPGGFVLVSDYGQDQPSEDGAVLEFQHYGGSIATGVNFGQIDATLCSRSEVTILAPATTWNMVHARLIAREPSPGLLNSFRLNFHGDRLDAINKPMEAARTLIENHQLEAARWKFEEALRHQPLNWALHDEIAGFLCYTYGQHASALKLARHGLSLNPLSTSLWNVLGDALFYLDRKDEAARAYLHALKLNSKDVRSHLNVANILVERDDQAGALRLLTEALILDQSCQYRDMLIEKQTEALQKLAERQKENLQRELNRFRGHRRLPT